MGRTGNKVDGKDILYGGMVPPGKRKDPPAGLPGIFGDLQAAGVEGASQDFEIWEDDSWMTVTLRGRGSRSVSNSILERTLEDFIDKNLRSSHPDWLEKGMTGTATYDLPSGKIALDIYENTESEEAQPWSTDTPDEISKELRLIGALSAEVGFDGYGDSGDVDRIDFSWPDGVERPAAASVQEAEKSISEFVFRQLAVRAAGWEINSGSFGTARITAEAESEFDFVYRVDDSVLHQATMDPETGELAPVQKGPEPA